MYGSLHQCHHPSEAVAHLAKCDVMLGVIRQAGVMEMADFGVFVEVIGDGHCVCRHSFGAQRERRGRGIRG